MATVFNLVAGDYREIQAPCGITTTRFFYTAENVYKGHAGVINYYSGPDRGHETLTDGVNLKLPSGFHRKWGNIDFDVNLAVSERRRRKTASCSSTFSIRTAFLGDMLLVNHQYRNLLRCLPRKYRFRILMQVARFIRLVVVDAANKPWRSRKSPTTETCSPLRRTDRIG